VTVVSTLDALLSYEGEKRTFQDVSFGKDKTPTIGTWKLSFSYMGLHVSPVPFQLDPTM
jgi:hypothetical protein